jgi:hypothetical protein
MILWLLFFQVLQNYSFSVIEKKSKTQTWGFKSQLLKHESYKEMCTRIKTQQQQQLQQQRKHQQQQLVDIRNEFFSLFLMCMCCCCCCCCCCIVLNMGGPENLFRKKCNGEERLRDFHSTLRVHLDYWKSLDRNNYQI